MSRALAAGPQPRPADRIVGDIWARRRGTPDGVAPTDRRPVDLSVERERDLLARVAAGNTRGPPGPWNENTPVS